MNHCKWALIGGVSVMPVSTISDVLSTAIKWRACANCCWVPNVPPGNTHLGLSLRWIMPTSLCINQKKKLLVEIVCVCVCSGGGYFPSGEVTIWRQPSFQMATNLLLSWMLTHNHNSLSAMQKERECIGDYEWEKITSKSHQWPDKGSKSWLALRCDCIVRIRC